MNLHEHSGDFNNLIAITSQYIGIPESAVKRDYYIVKMLQNLSESEYADLCIFKGGTSLSKCYPGSINRFSEDIDLTFIPDKEYTNKQYNRALKKIEMLMSNGAYLQKIQEERNDRNKSSFVWFGDDNETKIKLEIGSSVRPDPYDKRRLKTYIQEYLESINLYDAIEEFELKDIMLNVLAIERTFLDKVMSVKRHAVCGTLINKVRHIYDVVKLYERDDIQVFLSDKSRLKELINKTKETDSFYLKKRNVSVDYNPKGAYDFNLWSKYFDTEIKKRYEKLHEDLLYTDEMQRFDDAVKTFKELDKLFIMIDE